jgi:chaperonin GroES
MSKPKLTPIGGNILVKPVSEEKTSAAGIVLPDTIDKEKPQKGKVIALGTGKLSHDGKRSDSVLRGRCCYFQKISPDEITVDGEDYLIMEEDAILAVIK